jgi:CubicO group peptidase (beta-lactamase class C family)/predicted aspartyl protease
MKTFICTLALLIATTLIAAEPAIDQIKTFVDKAAAEDKFSGVVLVAKDGTPLLLRAWGMADPAKGIANRPDTKFNIGSINKIFTHVAIGQLAAAGKLSLSDTISKYLPDLPVPSADKITIEQLLQHRSGLGDIFGPKFMTSHASLRKLSDYVPLFANNPLEFEPGADQKYSNAGFIVLGLIVEKVSGQSYYDYIRDHITRPAGMMDTASYAVDEKVPNRALGLTKRGPEGPLPARQDNINTLPGRPSSAGGGYSTATDLLRFSQALLADKLLPKRWTDWIFSGKLDATGHHNIGVAGGSPGVNAVLEIEPPYTVIVMSNFDPPAAMEVGAEARKVLGIGDGLKPRRGGDGPGEVLIGGNVQLPMDLTGHVPIIEAKVNGKGPFRFQVDTGFGGMIEVTAAIAQKLALPMIGESIGGDPSGKNQRTMRLYSAESVDVGEAHFGQVEVSEGSPHFEGIDGVIGLQLFKSLIVTFDYPKGRFEVDGGALPPADGTKILTYRADRGVPNIDIDVAGQKVKTDIDSGSPALVSIPLSLAKSLPLASEPQVVGHGRTVGNEFAIYSASMKGDVHIGGITLTDPRIDFVDLFPVGNIGFAFLKDYVVTFDPANHRVRFNKP